MAQTTGRFNRQPAHVLIVDLSKPFNHDILANLYESVTGFFSLVTHINGPCRVPLFGLTTVGQYSETIFPLQPIKGNFSRLYSVMTEFKRSAMDTSMPQFEPESFVQSFNEVISQYQRQQQTFRQVSHSACQLEISVLSCQPACFISEQVSKLTETLDLNNLKKVQVLSVAVANGVQNEMNSQSTSSENGSDQSDNYLLSGMVDVVRLENDVLCFLNFFKTWLKDCGTDRESIHIILPSKLNNSPELIEEDDSNSSSQMVLKCDLHESFIDPSSLLCSEYFSLKGDFAFSKAYSQANKNISTNHCNNKIHILKAFCMVKTKGICESVVYGLPSFVRPTCCWKLDWEELESNQQDFNALCSVLYEKDLSLIVRSEPDEASQMTPTASYLLMASSISTLLIKSIAVEELMLPSDFPCLAEKPSQESTQIIEDSLSLLPTQDVYNPYFIKSNLFKFFVSKTVKNNPTSRGNRRKFQAPQKAEEPSNTASRSAVGKGQGKNIARQSSKKTTSFQSPRIGSAMNSASRGGRTGSNPRRAKTLPAVVVVEANDKLYD